MHKLAHISLLGTIALVASCSRPAPAPIMPEPVYDKYGAISEAACRPAAQPVSTYYPANLPTCESFCGQGQVPNYNGNPASVTQVPMCVPIGDKQPGGNDGGNTGGKTGGKTGGNCGNLQNC